MASVAAAALLEVEVHRRHARYKGQRAAAVRLPRALVTRDGLDAKRWLSLLRSSPPNDRNLLLFDFLVPNPAGRFGELIWLVAGGAGR